MTTSPARLDQALAAAVLAATAVEVVVREDLHWRPAAAAYGLVLALSMLWRRTRPLVAAVAGIGTLLLLDVASVVAEDRPFTLYAGFFILVLVYSAARWGTTAQAAIALGIVLLELVFTLTTDFTGAADALGGLGVLLLATASGVVMRYRQVVHAQQLDQVRSLEREMLARELHDTVAHHVSAIAVQAQAGRALARGQDLAGATEALAVIEEEASRTLTEMRSMVSTLRTPDGASPGFAQRGVADLADLAAADGTAGPPVEVERRGDLDDLSPAVQAALFRVAQESVTNARRHARNATIVAVTVEGDARVVRLTVTDDGERGLAAPRTPGFGLVGMAERVSLLGGTLEAGWGTDRGWTVRAVIPRKAGAA